MELFVEPPSSYKSLSMRLSLDRGIPYVENWSAAADFLDLIAKNVLTGKPSNILECGSGMTTLVLARACQMAEAGHVYTLENGEEHVRKSQDALQAYGLSEYATVIHAPLVDHTINDQVFLWYSLDDLSVGEINMFVIDGPPGFIQKNSRYPALPIMYFNLSDGCQIFLDDAGREDEKEIVQLWQEQFPGCNFDYIELERGCSKGVIKKSNS